MEGEGMAVEVGRAEFVEIDEDQMADGGTGEGFGGGGADGAEAGDDDAGAGQPGEGGGAEEEFEALEGGGHGREPNIRKMENEGRSVAGGCGAGFRPDLGLRHADNSLRNCFKDGQLDTNMYDGY